MLCLLCPWQCKSLQNLSTQGFVTLGNRPTWDVGGLFTAAQVISIWATLVTALCNRMEVA